MYSPTASGTLNGVEIPHRSIVNMLMSMRNSPGIDTSDVVLALSHPAFHASLLELWLPLCVGAQTVIVPDLARHDGSSLRTVIEASHTTVLQSSPTILRKLLDAGWQGHSKLKLLVGGEPIDSSLVARLQACCQELWQMFGHTETASWVATKRLTSDDQVTLGDPIYNTTWCVLDDHLQRIPPGVPGELFVTGLSLTKGYWNRSELNAQRFIEGSVPGLNSQKGFRTGEIVRRLATGELEWMGNRHHQLMIQGRDVNVRDIETVLHQHPSVDHAAVLLRDETVRGPELVAYLFASEDRLANLDRKALTREHSPIDSRQTAELYVASTLRLLE